MTVKTDDDQFDKCCNDDSCLLCYLMLDTCLFMPLRSVKEHPWITAIVIFIVISAIAITIGCIYGYQLLINVYFNYDVTKVDNATSK